jgi:methyl-accepting chemotaxis protein
LILDGRKDARSHRIMWTLKLWQKLALMVLIILVPISVLGYQAIGHAVRQLGAEKKRLAGLQHLHGLRGILEELQKHRTVAHGLLTSGTANEKARFQLQVPVVQDHITEAIESLDDLDAQSAPGLRLPEEWDDVKERWEDLKAAAPFFRTPQQIDELHARLLADVLNLVSRVADQSGMPLVTDRSRYFLYDSLTSGLPAQTEALCQTQALAAAVARRKQVTLPERTRLGALSGQIQLLRDQVDRDAAGAFRMSEELREQFETPVVVNSSACDDVVRFIDRTLLQPGPIDVDSAAVFDTAQKPIDNAFRLYDAQYEAVDALTRQQVQEARRGLYLAIGSLAAGLLLCLGLVAWLARGITRQVQSITDTFAQVEQGNYQARAQVRTRDELGRMAGSLNRMLDNTLVLIQSREERDRIQQAVARLLTEVNQAAAGDLTCEARVSPDLTGPIADAFNFMIRQLRQIITRVQNASALVSSSADQMQQMTEQLSQGSTAQASQIQQTTQALGTMATAIQRVSVNAAASAAVAQEALSLAGKGREAVEQTTEGMNHIRDQVRESSRHLQRLGEGARQLAQVGALVDEIAEWTSILSLNVSLQASVAGADGHRYRVIAESAERLAGRASDAARKLTGLNAVQSETAAAVTALEESVREVVDSSLIAHQAGQALIEIQAVAHRLAQLIQGIAGAARQQAQGSEALSRSMNAIADVTQKTARGTKQAAVSATGLVRLAEELRGSVSAFRVPDADTTGESFIALIESPEAPVAALPN